jgi:hypothetical protein
MATKVCTFCNKYPAKHLEAAQNGPVLGLLLEHGSDDFCTDECWEADIWKQDVQQLRSFNLRAQGHRGKIPRWST